MPRHRRDYDAAPDDDSDDWDAAADREFSEYDEPDDDDYPADDSDVATVECPHCRREVYEEAERCPYCEQYLSQVDSPMARRPWWFVLGLVACLYAVYLWIFG